MAFETPAPELVWGLVSRGIGLSFLIAFASLAPQVLPIAGSTGLMPISEALRAQTRDFPGWRRFVYFPTLLWLSASDRSLRVLVGLGTVAAASIVIGGPHTPWAFVLCWLSYLSLDRALTLIYPWDALLLEAGFWAAFLPATLLLPQLSSVTTPSAPAAWLFRLLAFRVLFGFGKHKFAGSTPQDRTFLRGFLVSQPLPTYFGWLAHHAPRWVHVLGLYGLFVLEIVAPFAVFAPGVWAALAAVAVLGLMIGIHLSGNYGHFNWILSAVVLSWLDDGTARQLTAATLATPMGALFILHTLLALFALPFNTFSSFTWTLWAMWRRVPVPPRRAIIALARWLMPFRIVHAYGVFPPQTPPSVRFAPVAEVTWDGEIWHELTHRYWPTQERSAPRWCAPHHERFDQAVVYESLGLNEQSLFRGPTGRWDPYGHGGVSVAQRLLQRILSGGAPGDRFYDRSLERQHGTPRAIRVRLHMLTPTTPAEQRATGRYWTRELIGPHFPPQQLSDMYVEHALPPPELWHFEDTLWLRRSRFGQTMAQVARGADPHSLIADAAPELAAEVDAFWNELVPTLEASFDGLATRVAQLRAQYGRARLYAFERIANRYAALLFARLDPQLEAAGVRGLFASGPQAHGVDSLYSLRLLSHHIVGQGRASYDAVMRAPERAGEYAADMTMFSAHRLQAVFRYEWLIYQSQKQRLLDVVVKLEGRRQPDARQAAARAKNEQLAKHVFGALAVAEFLKTQFLSAEHQHDVPEQLPRFAHDARDEVVRVR
jgi:hypothetical protein